MSESDSRRKHWNEPRRSRQCNSSMAWAGVLAIRLRPFLFSKKEFDLLDAIFYEVHTLVRRRGADDDATPSSASQKRTHRQRRPCFFRAGQRQSLPAHPRSTPAVQVWRGGLKSGKKNGGGNMMMQAVLSNPSHLEYGVVTIPFPIGCGWYV